MDETVAGKPPTPSWRGWAKGVAIAVLALLAAPYVIALAYTVVNPPASTLMVLRSLGGTGIDYRWRDLEDISPQLVHTVVASEDARICLHGGVDWTVMRKLVERSLATGEPPRVGGSTIAMQTAKNLFLWPGRSYVRKALELPLASFIGLVWSKRRLVEVYVNIAEWAPGVYGAEAAAQRHFGKPASRLSAREAALLAAALPNPLVRNAGRPGPKTRRYARKVRRRVKPNLAYLGCLRLAGK